MQNYLHSKERDLVLQTFLEKSVSDFLSPWKVYIQKQTASAQLLILCSVFAMIAANTPWFNPVHFLSEFELGLFWDGGGFSLEIIEWINSGLMALFFFVIGLEVKRSVLAGELQNPRHIGLIVMAALGGMIVPSIIYALINYGHAGSHGWAIPMATDTAFSLGVLAILGKRIAPSIAIFLAALAIFDDIGAILAIALFYTDHLTYMPLLMSLIPLLLLFCANKMGVTKGWVFFILGVFLWYFIFRSGLHATLAGLLVALTIPAKGYISQNIFLERIRGLLSTFEENKKDQNNMLSSPGQHNLTLEIYETVKIVSTPLQRWEISFLAPVSIVILPLFALFNAGITLSPDVISSVLDSRVALGIIAGLVIGKPLGVFIFSYLGARYGIGGLPEGMTWHKIIGVGFLAGIGFTMSIFITALGFNEDPELVSPAKIGILSGSIISAILGSFWLIKTSSK